MNTAAYSAKGKKHLLYAGFPQSVSINVGQREKKYLKWAQLKVIIWWLKGFCQEKNDPENHPVKSISHEP